MKQRLLGFVKREPVLLVSALLALVSACFAPPSAAYLQYIDFRTLGILFCLMAAVAGLSGAGVFVVAARRLSARARHVKSLSLFLTLLCFLSAMLITNDVALITFVPLTLLLLEGLEQRHRIFVVVMETVAANLGSMLTPVGNPQNLYLYARYGIGAGEFFAVTAPVWAAGLLLTVLAVGLSRLPRTPVPYLPASGPISRRTALFYGAVFLLYDSNHNPIGEYVTDQDGYIYADEGLADGRYYLREIKAAQGYVLDPELKTIYVRYGSTTEIEWSNTAECGQIQVIKKSANDNPINGLPAGTLLEGAVFEIYDKAGNVVDTIKSDRNGRAISKTLPLSRYTVREIKAPANYSINPTVMTAYLEFNGQIVTFEAQNASVSTGVSIKKTGPVQAVPGQPIRYVFSQIKNSSNVALDSFYWRDQLPAQVTLSKIVTGSYNQPLSYKVVYKTNLSGDYRTLADNLSTSKVYVLDARPAVLGLAANERVTEVMFVFGNVKAGFAQVETPYIYATARSGLANNASVVNVADVGGLYNGQWIQAVSRWLTTVYTKTTVRLPKTGY